MNIASRNALQVGFILSCFLLTSCGGAGSASTSIPPATPTSPPVTSYTVGGTLTGLAPGNSITLTDNASDNLTLTADGPFTFATEVDAGATYALTIAATTPVVQPCTSTNGAGTIGAANVTNLNVFCGLAGGAGMSSTTGAMTTPRARFTTIRLQDGQVLAAGGVAGDDYSNLTASSELYNPLTGTWTATGSMATARADHTATLLSNGDVLVAGGHWGQDAESYYDLSSSELYNPATGSWAATGSLPQARIGHTATLLLNGQVLVAGAETAQLDMASELYDPAKGVWTATGSLNNPRALHTATLLPNGKVLVAGGLSESSDVGVPQPLWSAELYDPATGTWTLTGSLVTKRYGHTATLLPNGQVLVTGGREFNGQIEPSLADSEIYDPASGTWSTTGSLADGRTGHTATLLPTGSVLVTGGGTIGGLFGTSELYDPATGVWTTTGALVHYRVFHAATLLIDGSVLISGGIGLNFLTSSELYF